MEDRVEDPGTMWIFNVTESSLSEKEVRETDSSSCINFHRRRRKCYNKQLNNSVTTQIKLMFIYFLFISELLFPVCGQSVEQVIRPFPPLFNAAQNRPIITEPSQSTCGVGQRSSYCKSSIFPISTEFCNQDFCVQTCPGRTEIPTYESLLPITDGFSNCVVADTINTHPGSSVVNTNSTAFIGTGPMCFLTPAVSPTFSSAQEFTITLWIWQERNNDGTLIQKRSKINGEIIFELNLRQSHLNFVYNSTIGLLTVTFPDEIPAETWTYIAIQVYGTSLSFYENGVGPGFSAAYTVSLVSQVQEAGESWVRVGLTLSGTYQFLGRLQDFRFYPVTLSNREIAEDYSSVFPPLRAHTSCRCPASHPRVKPLAIHYCIRNGVADNTNDHILRLNTEAHPIEYVNDGDANSIWISKNMDQANLVVDLGDEFQVFYVVVQFYSPLPRAVEIQRQQDDGLYQWETWQQFADSCPTYFNTLNNGPLPTPTSVNCLEQSDTAYSKGNITFNILSPEPVPRPGYNDFYNTPELFGFVRANKVRVQMRDHYYVTEERHKYYGLYEYSVVARCDCHGHAAACDHSSLPYQCDCLPESHTQGRMCSECEPLYNDKAFWRGDQLQAYNCRPCECYSHALSCTYNPDIDPFPQDHFSGGGGVCDDCLHNTDGRFCETCITGYFRPDGKSMYDEDVCTFCDCYPLGVQELQMDCEKEGGQCLCKENVEGRQCRDCKPGFYDLTAQQVEGCHTCDCHLPGTDQGDGSCSADLGECNCKLSVRGMKCDLCQYSYFNLTSTNSGGCESCNCNPFGSTNKYCDPTSGQCICKPNVVGRKCDSCAVGYWAFEEGCIPCNCDVDGTEPPARCNTDTGQCECKVNVEGLKCNTCRDETFGFGLDTVQGCHDCICTPAGTIGGSSLCNKITGDCVCKDNVKSTSCNQCQGNTWGLSLDNELGCVPCECDATGTQLGESLSMDDLSCHQNTGQCSCLANRLGRQCDDCAKGYFVSVELGGGCLVCDCHAKGSLPLTECDSLTGQCECRTEVSGVTGMSCDQCLEGHYGFNGQTGECSPCDCAVAGSMNDTCDPIDGQCFCKEFTWKRRCDRCVKGSSTLEASNPYGCSKAPGQQPQPYHEPLSPTSLRISWKTPDYPNGVINQYRVFRNNTLIFTVAGDVYTVDDTDLLAHTNYSYVVEATNSFGSVQSRAVVFQTPAGAPIGVVLLTVTDIHAKSAHLTWNPPQTMNGPLLKYVLHSTTQRDPTHINQWEGKVRDVTLTSLIPFTNYIFNVDSCTTGGCLVSEPVYFVTMSAVPEGMRPPVVMAVNNTALYVHWEPPEFPNGIIIFYELWVRGAMEPDGTRNPTQMRVFHPGGQYNTRPTQMPQENALPPPETNFTLSGLIPFTVYEFQVLAENNAGKAASPWVSGRTGATTPLFTPAPIPISASAYSLNVTWTPPSDLQSRGIIIQYKVFYFMKTNLTENPFGPPYSWVLMYNATGDEFHYMLHGLSPYSSHKLMIQACNSVGCVNSTDVDGRTQQAVPEGLIRPDVDGLNSSAMSVIWVEPAFRNGPAPFYTVQKTIPALSYPPQVIRGTRFPGGGYYLFPPDTIPPNVEFTGIRFWFRTRKRDGLLLFAASEGRQSEFVALQFKAGRPWFLFDPQGSCINAVQIQQDPNDDRYVTFNDDELHYLRAERYGNTGYIYVDQYKGCASFVTPFNDEGLPYNDNTWHQMIAWRDEKIAYISIDGIWEGARESNCAKGTIIGPNTGVYVGGLPANFEIRRSSNDQRAKLVEHSFQGCIRDIQVMQQKFPTEVWKTLDWNDALANELAFLNWEGCPINLDKGVHFMGQGFARFPPDTFQVGDRKLIEFGFRTNMHTGIIFFAYGGRGIYIYCAIINGALHFEFANGISPGSVTFNRPGTNFCDSQWYDVTLEKDGQMAKITIDGIGTETSGNYDVVLTVLTVSEFYVGGIPLGSEALNFVTENKLSMPVSAFGGCIRELVFDTFYTLDFLTDSIEVANINMDGCTPYHTFAETCRDDLLTEVYNGTDLQVVDSGLQPYTDYLYRILATNDAGSGTSSWGYGRTKEGAPIGVTPPYEARMLSGFIVEFKWNAPISTAGLLTQLILRGYNLDNVTIDPVEALFLNTSKRIGNITHMIPHTQYSIMMLACTSGGCAESEDGLLINTMEEAPQLVQAPESVPGPTYIYVYWIPPLAPNGIITGYFLYMDGDLIYTGGQKWFNVTEDLQIFTSYVFNLKACTQVGCTTGPSSTLSTAQLPPLFLEPPRLTPLGTTTVEARWQTPELIRGILQRYVLYVSTVEGELGTEVYNNTDFFLDYIIPQLIAGTTYYISISACTGGGCTTSEPANVTTEESAPDGVQSPIVTSPSPSQLHVIWSEPMLPNGEIVRYDLYHNEVPVYTGMGMQYDVGDMLPYSLHAFRVTACTVQGCSSSTLVKARTQEAPPQGFVAMETRVEDPRTVSIKWNMPVHPNGMMYFDVFFEGIFYSDPDAWDYVTVFERRSLHRSQTYGEWVTVTPVIPRSTYSLQVNASNTVGHILSNSLDVDMPPGSPDGVRAPNLLSQTPTTVTATWVPVMRANTQDDPLFTLQFRYTIPGAFVEDIFGPTSSFTYTKENLIAYTEYEFRLVADNSVGPTRSEWVTATTRQDRPAGFGPPIVVGTGPRYIDLVWSQPVKANGVIQEFKVYQNGQYRESTSNDETKLRADGLSPYTYHTFVVEVCTEGGCTQSGPSIAVRTLQDVPEEVTAPTGESLTPSSVELKWNQPNNPNGVISLYTIQRRLPGTDDIITIVTVGPSDRKVYIDDDATLTPHADYEYRLIVTNGAGDGISAWVYVTTMSSRPAGIAPPTVRILGPTVLEVSWEPPLQPNGVIEFYTVRLPEPRVEVRNTSVMSVVFDDLVAYMEYEVTVTACTSGGCTQSAPVTTRTHATVPMGLLPPVATPVSQSMVSLIWQGPSLPNGPNIRYELSRLLVRQPLNPLPLGEQVWESLYTDTGTFYEDRGLPLFTTYQYRLTVYNDVGQLTSEPTADVTTFGGFPRIAATVTATAISHVAIGVSWTPPSEVELQGSVDFYTVRLQSHLRNYTQEWNATYSSTTFGSLSPNTEYTVIVSVTIHGGGYITSDPITVATLDGAPEGVDRPTVTIVSETALRVSWMAPMQPNGEITGYNIYINGEKIQTGLVNPGSYVVSDLHPYTVYAIEVEVCTVFDCVKSETVLSSTLEALPQGVASPRVTPLSSYEISVMWQRPVQPNGIVLRYDLWRRTTRPCSDIPVTTLSPEVTKCTYIQCGILQNLCGSTCYSGPKVCCDGVLHESHDGYHCCGTEYVPRAQPTDVCCGGTFHTYQQHYQCCRDRYVKVLPGETCCPDDTEDRVAIGSGDSCCGHVPYSTTGAQVCCGGSLHESYERQCCGREMVPAQLVCCGGSEVGHAYSPRNNMVCCDRDYVQADNTRCCTSDTGHIKVHHYASPEVKVAANEQCCGLEVISRGLSCCNYMGYTPATQVCADLSHHQSGCGGGTVCPRSQKSTAFCDVCDFDPYSYMCGSIDGLYKSSPAPPTPDPQADCVVTENRIYSGPGLDFLDGGLQPFSHYEYAVSVINSAGSMISSYTAIKTLQARPENLNPVVATLDPKQLYIIFLSWEPPQLPNGEILRFILARDGIELYRGLDYEYVDDTTILPYRSYSYILTACTVAGCISSPKLTVATAQAPPEDVPPPQLSVVNQTTLTALWSPPTLPNGIIVGYELHFWNDVVYTVYNTTQLYVTLYDLLPFTTYEALVQVCTEVGCTNSTIVPVRMPESAPEGVVAPSVIVNSATSVSIYWSPPLKPNGEIFFYSLLRTEQNFGVRIFLGESFYAIDTNLTPGETYNYFIITGTMAGNTSSNATTVTMPDNTPSGIGAPSNVTVLSATEIYVEWLPIFPAEGVIDQYRVLLNAGRPNQIDRGVGLNTDATIAGLLPFERYEVRLQACLQGVPNGCGTGPGTVVQTLEAAPSGLTAPIVTAEGPDIVEITWTPPGRLNGVLKQYLVYYRQFGSNVTLLINRVNGETFMVRHAGQELTPYTQYEYQIVAGNAKGDTASPWSLVRTKAASPRGLPQPFVNVTGAFSVDLKWVPPAMPNGVINMFKIIYKQTVADPTIQDTTRMITVPGTITRTSVSGLTPHAEYQLQLQASNSAGNVSSVWTTFLTRESAPAGLGTFDIEKITTGQAVILRWGTPVQPNGIITTYRIYEEGSSVAAFQGLNREFELRRLEPYTRYSVQLEVCTSAGCTRSFSQGFLTAEVAPQSQASPIIGEILSHSVSITWGPPLEANGRITQYEIVRRHNRRIQKRSLSEPIVVYRTTDTSGDSFSYTDTNLQPFTEYQYSVKATNSKGTTQSQWQSAFTEQAPPTGVQPPMVSYVDDQVDALFITWETPANPNGILQSFQLQRNTSVPLSFTILDQKEYTDIGLKAYTFYRYTITVCSGGGCTTSEPSVVRTKETAPLTVSSPTVYAVNSTALRISWQRPQIATGQITAFQLHMNGIVVYEGMNLEYLAVNLISFTDYVFRLTACTNGGCTDSGEVTGKTEDKMPQNMRPPILHVMSSRSVEITWQEPEYPNGIITSYDVRRQNKLIYTESISVSGLLRTTYIDYNLEPGTEYAYVVTARNRKGSVESPVSMARTFSSSPSGLDPPGISPVSATSIQVTWQPPANPNGLIRNYTLFRDGEIVYSGSPVQLNYVVPGLEFWTEYTFRVQACTDRGCELSASATGRTLGARPEEQPKPTLLALANQDGSHAGVLVEWQMPLKPNGIIKTFEVWRRGVLLQNTGTAYLPTKLVYNGSALQYTDKGQELAPYSIYEYSVTAGNGVGTVGSQWTRVTTKEAPPDTVSAPHVNATTASTISVIITPPTQPNGVVRYYNVLVNNTVASSSPDLFQTVGQIVPLVPFRFYAITVQACTAGGCTTSPPAVAQTGTAIPSGLEPVYILDVNSTAVTLAWSHPANPNGEIRRFILYERHACPKNSQPFQQSCIPGEVRQVYTGLYIEWTVGGLAPYTAYEYQVVAVNDAGPTDRPVWVRAETTSAAPTYVKYPLLQKNQSVAAVDWSQSFILSGRLKEYMIMSEGTVLYRGVISRYSLRRASPNENIVFQIITVTEAGQAESPVIVFDPNAVNNIGSSPATPASPEAQGSEREFYEEIWFIVLAVLLGVLLLLTVLGCCVRRISQRHPYIRERRPLKFRQKAARAPFTFLADSSDGSTYAMDGMRNTDKSVYYPGSTHGTVNAAYTNGNVRNGHTDFDKVSNGSMFDDCVDDDDFLWDTNQDSGLVSGYDGDSLEAPSYTISKEQTVFTDTHL